jgi:hypothetical protein
MQSALSIMDTELWALSAVVSLLQKRLVTVQLFIYSPPPARLGLSGHLLPVEPEPAGAQMLRKYNSEENSASPDGGLGPILRSKQEEQNGGSRETGGDLCTCP